jgi:hypothetical protein
MNLLYCTVKLKVPIIQNCIHTTYLRNVQEYCTQSTKIDISIRGLYTIGYCRVTLFGKIFFLAAKFESRQQLRNIKI